MEDYQKRVVTEKKELDSKATALSAFIGTSQSFADIDSEEQERLRVQNDIMWQYSEILDQRIGAFIKNIIFDNLDAAKKNSEEIFEWSAEKIAQDLINLASDCEGLTEQQLVPHIENYLSKS